MSNDVTHIRDFYFQFCKDFEQLPISRYIDADQVFLIILAVLSGCFSKYGRKIGSGHPLSKIIKKNARDLPLHLVLNGASATLQKHLNKFLGPFPKGYVGNIYGDDSLTTIKGKNCLLAFDVQNIDGLNSLIRRYNIYGSFPKGITCQNFFASVVMSNRLLGENDFDLVLNPSNVQDDSSEQPDDLSQILSVFGFNENDHACNKLLSKYREHINEVISADPCVVRLSDSVSEALKKYQQVDEELLRTVLKFTASFTLLNRYSIEPKEKIQDISIFEATAGDFEKVFDIILECRCPLNNLKKNSRTVLELIKKWVADKGTVDTGRIQKVTGWSPSTISEAIGPLVSSGALTCKKEGASHKHRYELGIPYLSKGKKKEDKK